MDAVIKNVQVLWNTYDSYEKWLSKQAHYVAVENELELFRTNGYAVAGQNGKRSPKKNQLRLGTLNV